MPNKKNKFSYAASIGRTRLAKSDLKKMFVDYQCYYGGNKSKRKMDELKFNLFIKDFYEHGYSFIDERSILEKKLIKTK